MTTDDGYILGLVRIDCFGVNQYSASKGPILVVPDLSQDATSAASYRDKPFILELAEAGYDVWVMNRRGTYPSRAHTSLDPNSAEFWDFTNTEVANYDITAAEVWISASLRPDPALLFDVVLHELGHAFGLWGHSDQAGDALAAVPGSQPVLELSARDRATLLWLQAQPGLTDPIPVSPGGARPAAGPAPAAPHASSHHGGPVPPAGETRCRPLRQRSLRRCRPCRPSRIRRSPHRSS